MIKWVNQLISGIILSCTVLAATSQTMPEKKFRALVLGNNLYANEDSLPGSDLDAIDISRLLTSFKFVVTNNGRETNLSRKQMLIQIDEFMNSLDKNTIAVIYYSGHGLESSGENYLIPIDAKLSSFDDVTSQTIQLTTLIKRMERQEAAVRVIILDACRNMPKYLRSTSLGGGGLASIKDLNTGTKLVYAALPGERAISAPAGQRNSVFTHALLQAAKDPGVKGFDNLINLAGAITSSLTAGKQSAWSSGTLGMEVSITQNRQPLKASTPTKDIVEQGVDCRFFDCSKE